MADKIGMSVDFYRDIESGRNTGSIATMLNLCNVLKIPPDQFFEDLLNDLKNNLEIIIFSNILVISLIRID